MAVYKSLIKQEVADILKNFNIGKLKEYEPILQGIDNSNFKISTDKGDYILTIFNKRLEREDIPYYLDFMNHLKAKGTPCPEVIKNNFGQNISLLEDKYNYSIFEFMSGEIVKNLEESHIRKAALTLAQMHMAAKDFEQEKPNAVNLDSCNGLFATSLTLANRFENDLSTTLKKEINFLREEIKNYADLPKGNIHADFFPDNVFFNEYGDVSAVIDFYFSCHDFLLYDIMIAINAWCFEKYTGPNKEKIHAFLDEYQTIRPLTDDEKKAINFFGRVAAMRITATRVYDWFFTPKTAWVDTHNPLEYIRILKSYIIQETNIKLS